MLRKLFVALLSVGLLLALALPSLAQEDTITDTDALTDGVEITGIAEITTGVEVTQALEITETGETTDVMVITETTLVTDAAAVTVTETLTDAAAEAVDTADAETAPADVAAAEATTGTAMMTGRVTITDLEASLEGLVAAQEQPLSDVVEVLLETEGFSALVTALDAASLVESLQGEGPFFVFAPDDIAFSALPEGTLDTLLADPEGDLADILLYHVITRPFFTQEEVDILKSGGSVEIETLQGSPLTFSADADGNLLVNNASVFEPFLATNGEVYPIDAVLMPPADGGGDNGDNDNGDDDNGDDNGTIPDPETPETGAGLPTPLLYLIGALAAALLVVGGLFVRSRAGTKA